MEKILDTDTKTELDATQTASKKLAHKTGEAIIELTGNKIAAKNVIPKPVSDMNSQYFEETAILQDKRQEILHKLRQE